MSRKKSSILAVQNFLAQKVPENLPKALRETLEAIPMDGPIRSDQLKKKLKLDTNNALTRRLLRIEKSFPDLINREFLKGKQQYQIGFAKAEIQETTSLAERMHAIPRGVRTKNLYMGEMAWGTKATKPEIMQGLALFAKYNPQYRDVNNVMMLGSAFPRIPEFYSVSGSADMRFLGKRDNVDPEDRSLLERLDRYAKTIDVTEKDKEYFQEHIQGKIKTRSDAAEKAKSELENLVNVLSPEAEWHYQHGEEDRSNIDISKRIMLSALADEKKAEKQEYEDKIRALKKEQGALEQLSEVMVPEMAFMKYVAGRLGDTKPKEGDELRDYLVKIFDSKISDTKISDHSIGDYTFKTKKQVNALKRFFKSEEITTEEILEELETLKADEEARLERKEAIDLRVVELEHEMNSSGFTDSAPGFYKVTNQFQCEADEEEAIFRVAKKQYNAFLYAAVPKRAKGRFHVHSSAFNELTDDLSTKETGLGVPEDNDGQFADIGDKSGLIYLLAHNPKILSSNAASKNDLNAMKSEVKRRVRLQKEIGELIPDITLSSHGKGGFRYQPQLKFRETIVHGETRVVPEVVMHIKLPTIQSLKELETLKKKGLRNIHTKRAADGPFASGVVYHTIEENGRQYLQIIPESDLLQFAEVGKQIDYKKEEIKKAKLAEDETKLNNLQDELNGLEDLLRLPETNKLEMDVDAHLGSPNIPGRRTNYQKQDAAQRYQEHFGLPDTVLISEVIHAGIPKVCDTNKQYEGLNPKKFEDLLEELASDENLSYQERLNRVVQVAIEDKQCNPIPHIDYTVTEWKDRCLPYLIKVLDNGGNTILVSGNHYNKAGDGRDEAQTLANAIPSQYDDQVEVIAARGEAIGLGETVLPDGTTAYVSHKMKSSPDEIYGAMIQAGEQGIITDLVLFSDRHHGGGGYADGSTFVMGPGRQSWNRYVDQISKLSNPAGIVNVHTYPKKGYGGKLDLKSTIHEWAFEDCLDKYFMKPKMADVTLMKRKAAQPEDLEKKLK